jgi:NhaP-type Na+/H+ or K+/H+ antiporter
MSHHDEAATTTDAAHVEHMTPEHHEGHHIHDPVSGVFALCFAVLLLGQIVKHFCNNFKLPYTPILALVGLCIGSTSLVSIPAYAAWVAIPPHFIMLLFLPAIIFESAFTCDWYVFKKQLGKILILAGPMLILSIVATAFVMYTVLGYGD